ncbi:MAG TPA: hypothetical protein VFA70_05040 [Dehalococcoidia bacterium]|jgi:hypothetical protein|nr:hypothetical protein [Dehalococcoidia bacterium]
MVALVIVLAVVVVLAVGAAVWFYLRERRSRQLREHFGPEYDRAVRDTGDTRRAERELAARQERVERLQIRPLSAADRDRFADAWRRTQAQFVDDPTAAIRSADELIGDAMQKRGYPVGDFETRAADLSVDHPTVVSNYRAAHAIAMSSAQGGASTEDLRKAMVHYRALFDELVGIPQEAQR